MSKLTLAYSQLITNLLGNAEAGITRRPLACVVLSFMAGLVLGYFLP